MAERRRWWWLPAGLAIVGLAIAVDSRLEREFPRTVEVSLSMERMGAPIRVLHVSDAHGQFPAGLENNFEAIQRGPRPDLVAVTGDLIDRDTEDFSDAKRLLDRLHTLGAPIYYVPGNHEHWNPRRGAMTETMALFGVHVLVNRHEVLTLGDRAINVVGVDDAYTGRDRLEQALEGLDGERFTLLLSHSPAPARQLAGTPVELMLAGHTHGGQVRLPLVGALWAPGEGLFPHFDKGLYPLGAGKKLYIDSGLGTSMFPVRFLNPSQLSVLTIEGTKPPQ